MADKYDHLSLEQKWQQFWDESKTFKTSDDSDKPKYYALDMFPYPSGAGLHVGHPLGYTATDIISRKKRHEGYEVLHPMGWDSFGLPAENYAIKTQVHPEQSTLGNIETFKAQIKSLGLSYDWDREIATCLPDYYRWTQWFFQFLYKNDLAYRKKAPVNWCDDCNTVLANEQVVDGKCERCKHEVIPKKLTQWFFRVTDFIEDQPEVNGLLSGLDTIDWPESTKSSQKNWIGRKTGINIEYPIVELEGESVTCFTTRPDTNFGATFVVLGPEHPFLNDLSRIPNADVVEQYVIETNKKSEKDRTEQGTEKTGVFTGLHVVNRVNGKKLPLYVGDFVLGHVGTGAVVGVPGHDLRDFQFAQKMGIDVIRVVVDAEGDDSPITREEQVQEEKGTMVNSEFLDGLDIWEAKEKITEHYVAEGWAEEVVNYKLRDWLISRQRYWGSPIPVVYDDEGNEYLIPDDELPVHLPKDVDFNPDGESPLVNSEEFHSAEALKQIEEKLKATGELSGDRTIVRRESDTMDTFMCSSWYMWRFMDPKNTDMFCDPDLANHWGPIDLYVGGAEHTVLHLLYARFFCKALKKHGYINYDEPFAKLRHQGHILAEDGHKMSKSLGNVVNPDDIVSAFGADTLRCFEMFLGPFDQRKPWSTGSVGGIRKWLDRVYRVYQKPMIEREETNKCEASMSLVHKTIKQVTEDIDNFKFNTAISTLMIFTNELTALEEVPREALETFALLLSPFAPHLAEEFWQGVLGKEGTVAYEPWPTYDEKYLVEDSVTYAVQVNGKVRAEFEIAADSDKDTVLSTAKELEKIQQYLSEGEIRKEIFVPGKIVGFVVK